MQPAVAEPSIVVTHFVVVATGAAVAEYSVVIAYFYQSIP
jgi:hypothetical protein